MNILSTAIMCLVGYADHHSFVRVSAVVLYILTDISWSSFMFSHSLSFALVVDKTVGHQFFSLISCFLTKDSLGILSF